MKIQGQNKEMLATACQMFMGKSEGEIANIALETLEGHQRAIIAHLTVEVGVMHMTANNKLISKQTSQQSVIKHPPGSEVYLILKIWMLKSVTLP